jgi:hypothetical protein
MELLELAPHDRRLLEAFAEIRASDHVYFRLKHFSLR